MGRRIPLDEGYIIHPVLSFLVVAVGMAAAIAMITGLCGVRSRKKSSSASPSSSLSAADAKSVALQPNHAVSGNAEKEDAAEDEEAAMKELPLPPAMKMVGETPLPKNQMSKSASERKLKINMSMKVLRSLSVAKHGGNHKEDVNGQQKKGKIKADDSVWMKTIILGEKCKVTDEDEAVIYEGKGGKKISAYHPRTASSISFSRQSSFIDPDAITIANQTPTRTEKPN